MCLGSGHSPSPVDRADSMCLHGRPCVWLPFAAACCYTLFYLLMIPAARLVCQRPSSNFPYFRTALANFLLSRSNSVEYDNSTTTTLLPSAKCIRPLFQGRTGCGGNPSGWHDIVTCQRLVGPLKFKMAGGDPPSWILTPNCRVLPPGEFNGMSSQSHVSHCIVLPHGECTVVIPEPHATSQGAVTWRNQCHDPATTKV